MSRQVSPFAALSGAEKQIKWLEYRSVQLPYVQVADEATEHQKAKSIMPNQAVKSSENEKTRETSQPERPQPPPEIPRTMPPEYHKARHTQYDAVIARLKQAELQSRRSLSHSSQQGN